MLCQDSGIPGEADGGRGGGELGRGFLAQWLPAADLHGALAAPGIGSILGMSGGDISWLGGGEVQGSALAAGAIPGPGAYGRLPGGDGVWAGAGQAGRERMEFW